MTETKLNIVYLPVADIHPYSANPRKHGRESIDAIKQSIEQFGFKVPLQIDKDHVIVNGHGRLLAAKELGFTELPCIVCDDLEARKIRAFRISDNQVQAVSEWDMDTLQNELLELQKEDYDLNLLGFGEKLNMYLGGTDADRPNEGETDADDVPDINEFKGSFRSLMFNFQGPPICVKKRITYYTPLGVLVYINRREF